MIKKIFSRAKYYITILLASVFLISSSIAKAEAENDFVFKKGYNMVYQFIDNHDYLLIPLQDLIAGGMLCGLPCAFGGAALGVVDEAAVYYGYTDQRHLTHGILGAATFNVASPGLVSEIAGVVFGILLPTGELNLSGHQELIAPVISAAVGGAAFGTPGMVLGAAGGAVDELLIYNELADKHYITDTIVGKVSGDLLFANPLVANFVGVGLSLITAQWEKEFCDGFKTPVTIAKDLYNVYDGFIPQEQLNTHFEKQAISLVGTQLLAHVVSMAIIKRNDKLDYVFAHLDNMDDSAWSRVGTGTLKFAFFLIPCVLGHISNNVVGEYFNTKLGYALENKIRSEIYSDKNALRMSSHENYTLLMDELGDSVSTAVYSGNSLISNTVSTYINGAYGMGMIMIYAKNIVVFNILYNQAKLSVENMFASKSGVCDEKIKALQSDLDSARKDFSFNVKTIAARGGVGFTQERINNLTDDLRDIQGTQQLLSTAHMMWGWIIGNVNYLVNFYFVAREVKEGRIPFDERSKMQNAGWKVANFFSLAGENAQSVDNINRAIDRVIVIKGMIYAPDTSGDKIKRTFCDGKQLELYNLVISNPEKLLFTIDDLKLDMGKVYAVTGESGCRKSSLLSKIKGIKDNGILGTGEIHYPRINGKEPKIVMRGKDYFPSKSSLQEIISYPDKIPSDPKLNYEQRQEILALLKETNLEQFASQLDDTKDWNKIFSGGEGKRMQIVSAIIGKPDILILDEIFANLDPKSVQVVQQVLGVLKKYLPHTLIFIVDHYADTNNYDGFYDYNMHFADGKVTLRDMEP